MMKTYKILSALLAYPEPDLLENAGALAAALAGETLLPAVHRDAVAGFIGDLGRQDVLDAQEAYVSLFDRNRSLSLHLYEHVLGESRDRGQAMVELARLYQQHGYDVSAAELPDYLPLFLEFLSLLPAGEAAELLSRAVHVVAALKEKLDERGSPYAVPMAAVEALAASRADAGEVAAVRETLTGRDDSLEQLDRQWEEEAVRFAGATGPDAASLAAGCGR